MTHLLLLSAAIASAAGTSQITLAPLDGHKPAVEPSAVVVEAIQRARVETKASLTPSGSVVTWCEPSERDLQTQPQEPN